MVTKLATCLQADTPHLAADAEAIGGRYCEDCHVAEVVSVPGLRGGVQPYALDPQSAQALWQKSEELVGERFGVN